MLKENEKDILKNVRTAIFQRFETCVAGGTPMPEDDFEILMDGIRVLDQADRLAFETCREIRIEDTALAELKVTGMSGPVRRRTEARGTGNRSPWRRRLQREEKNRRERLRDI